MTGVIVSVLVWGGSQGVLILLSVFALIGLHEAFNLFKAMGKGSLGAFVLAVFLLLPVFGGLLVHVPDWRYSLVGAEDSFVFQTLALLLIGTKFQDISAYFSGRIFGGTPLAPSISPKKTRNGALGGVTGAALAGWGAATLWGIPTVVHPLLYGFVLGCGSLGGDLVESKLKRLAGIKDSGNVMPGFGGVLDMVDSFILAAPLGTLMLWGLGR